MGKFTVQQMKTGYKFNLKAGNGQIIASSELYHMAEECLAAIERVRRHAGAAVEDQTLSAPQPLPFPKFTVRHSERGSIRFYLYDEQGALLAHSKHYTAKRSCLAGIRSIAENAPGAPVITG
ncbi:MAG: YegP family protein [Clostridiaceae bacterium]|nr:YegP family protein [Clostridia bacterium]MDY3870114.1 YegP family protein [Clostridiaceae bacterium]